MSVLESMRSGTDSTFMQVIFAAVVVSFVVWGVTPMGDKKQTLVTVNGEEISAIDFSRQVRNAEYRYQRQSSQPLNEDARNRLREEVRQQMIQRVALRQEAETLGLEVSDTEVAREVLKFDAFKDASGRYDKQLHTRYLKQIGFTRSAFEAQLRGDLLVGKLRGLMMLGASVSDPIVSQRYLEQNTRLDIEYVRIRPNAFYDDVDPSDEEIAAWIADHDTEIQTQYDSDFERLYNQPEKVELSTIRLAVRDDGLSIADLKPRMDAILEELAGGADFAELARKWSEAPSAARGGSLGEQPVVQLDEDLRESLKDLEPGANTGVVVRDAELRIYQLDARTPAQIVPRADVQNDIASNLMRDTMAPALAAKFAETELLPAWKEGGEPPAELLESRGLRAATTGEFSLAGPPPGLFAPPATLIAHARLATAGDVLPEVYEQDGTLWVAQLETREDADMAKFDEERDAYREEALIERRVAFFDSWVDDVVGRAVVLN